MSPGYLIGISVGTLCAVLLSVLLCVVLRLRRELLTGMYYLMCKIENRRK